jgi:hypothetical protein
MTNLVDLTQLSDTELAEIRERYTRNNLTYQHMHGIAKIAKEYKRRGYSSTQLAHIKLRTNSFVNTKAAGPKKDSPTGTSRTSS